MCPQELEDECFRASASKTVYLGRLAAAVRQAGQRQSTGMQPHEGIKAKIGLHRSAQLDTCDRLNVMPEASILRPSPDTATAVALTSAEAATSWALIPVVARLEALQPYTGAAEADAVACLQQLKQCKVTADTLKAEGCGRRIRALVKSQNAQISQMASEVVSKWKQQLLQ